jgi:hypothetical protein
MSSAALICALQGLIGVAIFCLVLWVLWWAATTLLKQFGIEIPGPIYTILKVIAVLILVILILRVLLSGDVCGFFLWSRLR